jgi:NADPH:quinone reductase-like Zn-dependent oxidoreductase
MKAYQVNQFGLEHVKQVEIEQPRPASGHEVLVRFHAVSLNYRDLMFAKGIYAPRAKLPAIPVSDGAGEVTGIGEGVTRWKVGDRVCPIFTQGWLDGSYSAEKARTSLGGGDLDGVLREYGTFHENGLVRIPEHLSFEEAATLPCAAVTAWHTLVVFGNLKSGETILTLGTGGVSIFAIQFAKMHGARVIATSSSEQKLARLRELGVDDTINYKTSADWEKDVLRFTNNVGVDHVVEVGGAGTLPKSIAATRIAGRIGVIGVLASGGGVNPISILMKGLTMQGIFVGSRRMFEDMNRAISVNLLGPVIDKTFSFEEAPQALAYMESGAHFGKIVIQF